MVAQSAWFLRAVDLVGIWLVRQVFEDHVMCGVVVVGEKAGTSFAHRAGRNIVYVNKSSNCA